MTAGGKGKLAVVIGSGFGGAVTACRLAQFAAETKALDVILLERGHRYQPGDFPRMKLPEKWTDDASLKTSKRMPDTRRFLWSLDQGLWEFRNLGGLQVAQGAGYGGGSLVYASVHLRAPDLVFEHWPAYPFVDENGVGPNDTQLDRELLDPYYERVEAMLSVAPAPPRWPKTQRFSEVAGAVGGKAILPPLAINFEVRQNPHTGESQPACTGCGNCLIGCSDGAKNTLDRNYLALAEKNGLEVKTLAEVISIHDQKGRQNDDAKRRYRVCYRDHFVHGEPKHLEADYVFLCAGAVNSTEILHRSVAAHLLNQSLKDQLGERFFANGDALGVVFDTDQEWNSCTGPTITSSLTYVDREGPEKGWFQIQEGGFPPSLRRGLGLLRSPLWFGRNAYVTPHRQRDDGSAVPVKHGLAAQFDSFVGKLPSLLHLTRRARTSQRRNRPVDEERELWLQVMPASLKEIGEHAFHLNRTARAEIADTLQRFLKLLPEASRQGALSRLMHWFGRYFFDEEAFTGVVVLALKERLKRLAPLLDADSVGQFGALASQVLLLGPDPGEHMALFLAMGPDTPFKLRWRGDADDPGPTSSKRPLRAVPTNKRQTWETYRDQQRLMRDLAAKASGQLRTNPAWSLGRRPITVHSQGGCSMGSDDKTSVVKPTGEVWDHEGLFVSDGAIFPGSVGVNPSHTIAAVAELNVEQFIRREGKKILGGEAGQQPTMPAKLPWDLGGNQVTFDQAKTGLEARPMALRWEERMDGYVGNVPEAGEGAATLETLRPDAVVGRCEVGYRAGLVRGSTLHLRLEATVPDLEDFLLSDDSEELQVGIAGEAFVRLPRDAPQPLQQADYFVEGCLRVKLRRGSGRPQEGASFALEPGVAPATMTYDLTLTKKPDNHPESGSQDSTSEVPPPPATMSLWGRKYLIDDPGPDAWGDLTTLYTELTYRENGGQENHCGVIRVHLDDFLLRQLPSFRVGVDDEEDDLPPTRKLWALMRFMQLFFGNLKHLYNPGIF